MSLTQSSASSSHVASLPGAAVVGGIRRVLITSLIAAVAYATFMSASAGYCAGGFTAQGDFVDATGRLVDAAPQCVQLTLGTNPLLYLGIALIVLLAIGRVLRADDEIVAMRILDRSAAFVGLLVVVAIVVSQVWFHLIPITDFFAGASTVFSPFPFGSIDVSITPMPAPMST